MKKRYGSVWQLALGACLLLFSLCEGISIAEKRDALLKGAGEFELESNGLLRDVNEALASRKRSLQLLYQEAKELAEQGEPAESFAPIVKKVKELRMEIAGIQRDWQQQVQSELREEPYALWDQPETTLGQLVMDYGDPSFIYMIPPEIASQKLSVSSRLPIPVEAWGEMLETLLGYQGVGVKEVNGYLKQLYPLESASLQLITLTDERQTLHLLDPQSSVGFLLHPQPKELQRMHHFLGRFVDGKQSSLEVVQGQLLLMGKVSAIQELLKVYDFAEKGSFSREFRLVSLSKMGATEMARLLEAIFGHEPEGRGEETEERGGRESLSILALESLPHSLFLMGSGEEVGEAVEVIRELEGQSGDLKEKTLFRYRVKHSDPTELAEVLERVYQLLAREPFVQEELSSRGEGEGSAQPPVQALPIQGEYLRGVEPGLVVNPSRVLPEEERMGGGSSDFQHVIVEPKTGMLLMVVEKELLSQIKELLRRIDVPKQMVNIEVLLMEKRATQSFQSGMNLFRMGDSASQRDQSAVSWSDGESSGVQSGILEFVFGAEKNQGWPAFDLVYSFLLSQDNVVVNAAPSVTTLNQTPATIHIVEELSLNTGIVELDTTKDTSLKDAFVRNQYGITIEVTPTVHQGGSEPGEERFCDYITLETYINFDEVASSGNDRPNVLRRNVTNTVRVVDGETLVIGGLMSKKATDNRKGVPYLCDLPGLGKFFSRSEELDTDTEMYIFMTPTIVDHCDPFASAVRREVMCRRPGDSKSFLDLLKQGKEGERQRQLEEGLENWICEQGGSESLAEEVYDGR